MSVVCSCPAAASLETIPAFTCGANFGQIQKLAFQRLTYVSNSAVVRNGFEEGSGETANPIGTKSSWTTKMAANDGSKIVVTPFVEAPTQEGGDPITFGGGNDSLGGAETIVGRNASTISFALRKFPQSIIKALKALQCETNLGVYLFSEHNTIEAIKESETSGSTTTIYYRPIPIRSFFVGDKLHGGLQEPDSNVLQFAFLPNYSDDLDIVTPSFKPLDELIPAI